MTDHLKEGNVQLPKPSANDKLKDLKAKFTNSKTLVPPGIISNEKIILVQTMMILAPQVLPQKTSLVHLPRLLMRKLQHPGRLEELL